MIASKSPGAWMHDCPVTRGPHASYTKRCVHCSREEGADMSAPPAPAPSALADPRRTASTTSIFDEIAALPPAKGPLGTQEGGAHYKDMTIQPVQYIHANGIGFFEGNVIKYVSRWRAKGGVQDLRKARHFIDILIDLETKGAT